MYCSAFANFDNQEIINSNYRKSLIQEIIDTNPMKKTRYIAAVTSFEYILFGSLCIIKLNTDALNDNVIFMHYMQSSKFKTFITLIK